MQMNGTHNKSNFASTHFGLARGGWRTGALLIAATAGAAFAPRLAHAHADDAPVFVDTFEADLNTWMSFGPHARLGTTNESGKIKNGKSALAFNYRIDAAPAEAGQPPVDALVRPTPNSMLAKAHALSFWARSDVNAPFAVTLSEKDGGRYLAVLWLPKNQWQHVVLATEDFSLTEGKDDPKDPDGKLDMDQVESVTVLNLWSFFAMSVKDSPANAALFPPQNSEHSLWLDDFTASTATPAPSVPEPAVPEEKSGTWVESLRHDTLAWLPLGLVDIQIDAKSPTKGRAMRLDYTQEKGKITAVAHDLHRINLSRCDQLQFDVAATKASKILLTLEEKSGAKYNTTVDIAGDSTPGRKAVYFANFTLADDSPKDPDGKLNLDQLKSLTIIDVSAFFVDMPPQQNSLWIGPIRASLSK